MKLSSKTKHAAIQKETVSKETSEPYDQLKKVADRIEKMRLGDYIENMNRPGHLIWINLLSGISKGVGLTIGATLVIALLFKLLGALIAMNIPYLTEMLQDVVQIIKTTPGVEKFAPAETKNLTAPVVVTPENIKLNTEETPELKSAVDFSQKG